MDFTENEKLYRSIIPIDPFIKTDGSITSAAFKQKNTNSGLSFDRQKDRTNDESVDYIISHTKGDIISIRIFDCMSCASKIDYRHAPIHDNEFHSEVANNFSQNNFQLTNGQAKYLAKNCIVERKKQNQD